MSVMQDMGFEEEMSTSVAARQKYKLNFLEKEKEERTQYIKDMEATVLINKQIINDLCRNATDLTEKSKTVIEKLNKENTGLLLQVKTLKKQKAEAEGKSLIQIQIIEEHMRREAENFKEFKEKVIELRDQLNKKEYIIQLLEKRCYDAEQVIMRYLKGNAEAKEALAKIQANISGSVGITNVIEQNKLLKAKVMRLTGELSKVQPNGALSARGSREMDSSISHKIIVELKKQLEEENKGLKKQLEDLERENRAIRGENQRLQVDLEELHNAYENLTRRREATENIEDEKGLSQISSIGLGTNPENTSQDLPEVFEIERININ